MNGISEFETTPRGALADKSQALQRALSEAEQMRGMLQKFRSLIDAGELCIWHEMAADWMLICPICLQLPNVQTHTISHTAECLLAAKTVTRDQLVASSHGPTR